MEETDDNLGLGMLYGELNKFLTICHDHEFFLKQNGAIQKSKDNINKIYFSEKWQMHREFLKEKYDIFIKGIEEAEKLFAEITDFEQIKEIISHEINAIFHVDGNFSDYFDGYEVKFEPYKKEYNKLTLGNDDYNPSEDMKNLHYYVAKYFLISEIDVLMHAKKFQQQFLKVLMEWILSQRRLVLAKNQKLKK